MNVRPRSENAVLAGGNNILSALRTFVQRTMRSLLDSFIFVTLIFKSQHIFYEIFFRQYRNVRVNFGYNCNWSHGKITNTH